MCRGCCHTASARAGSGASAIRDPGVQLLKPVLDLCDRHGVAAYLETQNPVNVPFYERRGFVVSNEVEIPGGGPRMWLMRRPGNEL